MLLQKVPGESLKGLAVDSANRHLINAEAVRSRSYCKAGELETKWPAGFGSLVRVLGCSGGWQKQFQGVIQLQMCSGHGLHFISLCTSWGSQNTCRLYASGKNYSRVGQAGDPLPLGSLGEGQVLLVSDSLAPPRRVLSECIS